MARESIAAVRGEVGAPQKCAQKRERNRQRGREKQTEREREREGERVSKYNLTDSRHLINNRQAAGWESVVQRLFTGAHREGG